MADREKKTPEVSIVILNYQTGQLVLDLVKSLGKNPEIEIIVVDNSPEETLGKDLAKVNIETRYFFKGKNLGFSGGNNYGIKQALGEWILLLNSDTLTTSKDVLSLLEITKKNNFLVGAPKLVGREGKVQNNVGYFDGLLKDPINWLFARPRFIECGELNKEKEVNLLTGAAMLIHKSVFEKMGVLDDKNYFMYFEDIDFSYRLYQKGIKVLYVPQVKIVHFGGGSSNKELDQKNQNYNKGLDNYLLKHRGEVVSLLNRKVRALS